MQKIHIFSKLKSKFHAQPPTINPAGHMEWFISLMLLFCLSLPAAAQQKTKTKIILERSEKSRIVTKTDITYLRKPVFRQDNALLSCDSAVFYTARNYFEAYNNVHIIQADTINIYADRLNYDGNARTAHLTNNVRLVDKTSTLTTNILDYNMVPKIGTYVQGGKIVNKDATITSKNGYYFANTRDAYFRYDALVVTEQSIIKSDTLRYNTFSNWAYFYGPTNIKEKDGNLYTENGAYNTKTTYAYFGKNNLYTSGSRSMKGDSLYYDGIAGYGKAVKNIVFRDTVDKMLMRGQLGFYYKKDQRTLVTKNAYAGMGTNDSILVKEVKQPDSLWLGADTLETQMVLQHTLKLVKGPAIKKDNELGEEERDSSPAGKAKISKPAAPPKKPGGPPAGAPRKEMPKPADEKKPQTGKEDILSQAKDGLRPDTLKKQPSSLTKGDSSGNAVTRAAVSALTRKDTLMRDSLHKNQTAKAPGEKTVLTLPGAKRNSGKDSLPVNPLDTIRTRVIKAYHHVNVFKTNMQAKSDSLFYTSADSTLRWYKKPIIWSQGSQQTGDTIYLQLRNKKINSVQVFQNAFSVNVEADSAKFNQIKGKMITGFFKEGKLNSMYVDGNAESVYFTKTDDGKKYDKMNQTISSRIKVTFKNNDISDVVPIKNVEGATTPVADLKQDVILTGFIWKPELRPRSKKDITNPKAAPKTKKSVTKTDPSGNSTKTGVKETGLQKAGKALSLVKGPVPMGKVLQATKRPDSLKNKLPAKLPDTLLKAAPVLMKKADSLARPE